MTEQEQASLLQFPCEFPLKVFGPPDLEFESVVLAIVRRHVAVLPENAVRARGQPQREISGADDHFSGQ